MITIETLEQWLTVSAEHENLEFKAAAKQYDIDDVLRYCVAMSNEGGGYFVLGVTNTFPRKVTGTHAFASERQLNALKLKIFDKLHIRVNVHAVNHPDGRVLALEIPARPAGQPVELNGCYLMRAGESVVAMTPDRLKEIFSESAESWFMQTAMEGNSEDVVALLDTQIYFDLLNRAYPSTQSAVLQCLEQEGFIRHQASGEWLITHLGAIVLAKNFNKFPADIARKATRFVLYDGVSKINTREEVEGKCGYAVKFDDLVNFVHSRAPRNRIFEETLRQEQPMFPKQALRELIANALIHQDFSMSGASVMIEMYDDRVEISNPGKPSINVERFIDGYQSRNETLANAMRRFGVCEEKGSGIDKVINQIENAQLPPPVFKNDEVRTTATLFSHVDFSDMSKDDRIRACYQHCCLRCVSNRQMSNASLRARFGLGNTASDSSIASQVISATKALKLIKPGKNAGSLRYARYLPYWG